LFFSGTHLEYNNRNRTK